MIERDDTEMTIVKNVALFGTAVMAGALAVGAGASAQAAPAASAAPASTHVASLAAKDAPGTAFTAFGNTRTPWRAVVSKGVLRIEGKGLRTQSVKVTRSAFAKGVEFTSAKKGTNASLVIRGGRCIDANGKNMGQRATLTLGKRVFTGCAVNGAYGIANT